MNTKQDFLRQTSVDVAIKSSFTAETIQHSHFTRHVQHSRQQTQERRRLTPVLHDTLLQALPVPLLGDVLQLQLIHSPDVLSVYTLLKHVPLGTIDKVHIRTVERPQQRKNEVNRCLASLISAVCSLISIVRAVYNNCHLVQKNI